MENMGKQRLVNKTIGPAEIVKAMMAGSITTAQAQALYNGIIPIGDYKGIAAIFDLDLLVNQPLIWAEKQWTEDVLDSRNAIAVVTVPIGTAPAGVVVGVAPAGVITVPAGEVWYCTSWGMDFPVNGAYTAGDIELNFRVSSFPQIGGVDKLYICPEHIAAATAWGVVAAGTPVPGAQFGAGDEIGVPLRLVGGDIVTPVITVRTAAVAGADAIVSFILYGRKAKRLVS